MYNFCSLPPSLSFSLSSCPQAPSLFFLHFSRIPLFSSISHTLLDVHYFSEISSKYREMPIGKSEISFLPSSPTQQHLVSKFTSMTKQKPKKFFKNPANNIVNNSNERKNRRKLKVIWIEIKILIRKARTLKTLFLHWKKSLIASSYVRFFSFYAFLLVYFPITSNSFRNTNITVLCGFSSELFQWGRPFVRHTFV